MFAPFLRAAVLSLSVTAGAFAQDTVFTPPPSRQPSAPNRRHSAIFSALQSRPQGAFANHVGLGYGVNGAYLYRLDAAGIWSIRTDVGVLSYGEESRRTPFSETVGGRIQVDVKTDNYIVPVSVGPQLTWPSGIVRPYANAGVGAQAFVTESHVDGADNGGAIASTTNHSALAAAWVLGGGVFIPVYARATEIQLDLGAQYVGGGNARYLARGSIVDLESGRIRVNPLESTTRLVIVRIGARVGF